MTLPRRYGDAGQAFPIYITVVGGLLFLALAFFAVGQTAVNRNGAQTAADAAALAAAQDTRDQLADQWAEQVLNPARWQEIFEGNGQLQLSCRRAQELAEQNGAHLAPGGCSPGLLSYTVRVETDEPVGESVVPVTASKHSKANATAVIKPLCWFTPLPAGAGKDALPRLNCKSRYWDLDPKRLTDLPKAQDLFDVHLADQ